MRLIDLINIILVSLVFVGFSVLTLTTLSSYDVNLVKQGIIKTVNGPASNYLNK